jgi:hypothetical protein
MQGWDTQRRHRLTRRNRMERWWYRRRHTPSIKEGMAMGMWKNTWAVKELNWFGGEMEIIQFVSCANIHVADIDQFVVRRSVSVYTTIMHKTLCHISREHIHCIRRSTHTLLLMAVSVRSVIKHVAYQRNLSILITYRNHIYALCLTSVPLW